MKTPQFPYTFIPEYALEDNLPIKVVYEYNSQRTGQETGCVFVPSRKEGVALVEYWNGCVGRSALQQKFEIKRIIDTRINWQYF